MSNETIKQLHALVEWRRRRRMGCKENPTMGNRMPPETVQDWLEHASHHGMRHLASAPRAIRQQAAAMILGRT